VFALRRRQEVPLLLVAVMTFRADQQLADDVLGRLRITRRSPKSLLWLLITAAGASFVSMAGLRVTKLIHEGVRPLGNPLGASSRQPSS